MFAHKIIEGLDVVVQQHKVAERLGAKNGYLPSDWVKDNMTRELEKKYGSQHEMGNPSMYFDPKDYAHYCSEVIDLLRRYPVFYSEAEPGEMTVKDFPASDLKLPYEHCSFLFRTDNKTSPKVALLACSVTGVEIANMAPEVASGFKIVCYPVFEDIFGYWEIANILILLGEKDGECIYGHAEAPFAKGYFDTITEDVHKHLEDYAQSCINALLGYLAFLHCGNVFHEKVPAPTKLNKKRIIKAKEPVQEYRVLKVRHSDGNVTGMAGGLKSSPKYHTRRGHFGHRWKGTGKEKRLERVWVSPCVVGSKEAGILVKDYSM